MNSRALHWYIAFSFLLLIALATVFVYRVQQVRSDNYAGASRDFRGISGELAAYWAQSEPANEPPVLDVRLRNDPRIQVVSVYSYRDGLDYLWSREASYLGSGTGEGTAIPSIRYNELTQVQFTRGFTDSGGGSRIVTAVYTVLDGYAIFPVLRDTLIAILVFILIAIVIAVFQTMSQKQAAQKQTAQKKASFPVGAGSGTTERFPSPDEVPSDRNGMISPESGLSHESLLARRLTLELERSAFNEQDFSVAILEFTHGRRYDSMYRRVAETLLDFITFEDLCFEFGDERIVVLFPNSGLRETLTTIERFQRHVWQERVGWDCPDVDMYAGLSSRNGRLVDGSRLLHETDAALHHSYDVPGHIMGFEPDPQKYREFLLSE